MTSCIDKILGFYGDSSLVHTSQGRIWLSKALIRLMKDLDEGRSNSQEVENCLILLLNLFTNIENPDHYHTKGKSIEELSDEEKNELFELLKSEINRDILN